jgi:hypothetical protein
MARISVPRPAVSFTHITAGLRIPEPLSIPGGAR